MYGNLIEQKPSPPRGDGQHLLVVVDDPRETELLATTLGLAGYRVGTAGSGAEGMARVAQHRFDLVVWDAGLPNADALARGRRMAPADRPPLLFLATCDSLQTLVPELGPERADYVTKPLRIAEVLVRVQVLLGDSRPARRTDVPCYGDLLLDDAACRARRGPRPLDLTPAEYRLLRHLLANAEHVLSKEQICRYVWGDFRGDQAIEKLVSRLRRKVDQEEPALIHTRRGFGYWLGCADR
ncbi:response regulator transcription factor [Streptomyces fulvoviolaceus]|uniref:response regulator transcription factor n=1 Tax=Streptomyces fulvoviolaceus TaxID=285535 RepID=UPI0004C8E62E|nr:response regulator transcription factor [Streptomyces fulvoviolaceus]